MRAHDLDHFIRDAEAFLLDHGHLVGPEYNADVQRYRFRFEEIMGNNPGKNGVPAKDLEAGFGPRSTSPDGHAQMPSVQSVYVGSGHQVQPGQMPVSPMGQGPPMPGGYFPQAAQALMSPLAQHAQTGYVNGGAQMGATLQAPQMAHVPPTATTGYPVSQPLPLATPLSTPMR